MEECGPAVPGVVDKRMGKRILPEGEAVVPLALIEQFKCMQTHVCAARRARMRMHTHRR